MIRKPIDKHFFDEESKEMWYVLGVSYGTYFPERKRPVNTWSSSHLDLIEIIKRELKSGHTTIEEEITYKLRFRNEHVQSKLFERGAIPGKKNRKFPEDIGEQYLDHFVRGFFDGNVSCSKTSIYNKNVLAISYPSVQFLQQLYSHLVSHASVRSGKEVEKSPLNLTHLDAIAVHDFIYRDWDFIQERGLYLPLKKERFEI